MSRLLVSDIVSEVQTELSQVAGAVTNLYGTPRTIQHIQDAYLALIEEFGDRDLISFSKETLDGSTGVIDTNLTTALSNHSISRFEDIINVWVDGEDCPLPILPPNLNVYNITGDTPKFVTNNSTTARPFKIYPLAATGDVVVQHRAYPDLPLDEESYIYIDRLLIVYYAAYLYAQDDAASPGQIDKFERLFNDRLRNVKRINNNQAVSITGSNSARLFEWNY